MVARLRFRLLVWSFRKFLVLSDLRPKRNEAFKCTATGQESRELQSSWLAEK